MFDEAQDVQELMDRVYSETITALIQNSSQDIIPPDSAERFAKSASNMAVMAMKYRPKPGDDRLEDIEDEQDGEVGEEYDPDEEDE